jgi:hypothetical protein
MPACCCSCCCCASCRPAVGKFQLLLHATLRASAATAGTAAASRLTAAHVLRLCARAQPCARPRRAHPADGARGHGRASGRRQRAAGKTVLLHLVHGLRKQPAARQAQAGPRPRAPPLSRAASRARRDGHTALLRRRRRLLRRVLAAAAKRERCCCRAHWRGRARASCGRQPHAATRRIDDDAVPCCVPGASGV